MIPLRSRPTGGGVHRVISAGISSKILAQQPLTTHPPLARQKHLKTFTCSKTF